MELVAMTEASRPDVRYLFAEIARGEGRYFDAWTHALVGERTEPRKRWSDEYAKHLQTLIVASKGKTADARGDWQRSRSIHTSMRGQGDENLSTDLALGRASFHLGQPENAEQHFRRAATRKGGAKLVPELVMAALYEKKGETEKTESWFQAGEKAQSDNAERIRLEYVRWLLRQNRADDAKAQASKQRPSEARLRDFQYMIAMSERMKGNFGSSEKILEALHVQNATNFQVANQLALVLIESKDQGKQARALLLATRNLKAAPKAKDAITTLAWVKHRLGDTTEAEQLFDLVLRGGQASRDTAYYVANVKRALKKQSEADLLLGAAKKSNGEFFNLHRVDK